MKRVQTHPPDLSGPPLGALEEWLGISAGRETAILSSLLSASITTCEAVTGITPLQAEYEEILSASTDWQRLTSNPVQVIASVEGIPAEGSRFPIATGDYLLDLSADGSGLIRLQRQGSAGRIAVRLIAGQAADWNGLPGALRHGIIRLAAHYYRERDALEGASPPASVAALWQPYRRLRVA